MTVLFIFCYFIANSATNPLTPLEAIPAPKYMVPPAIAMGEFSSAAACEAAGQLFLAELKAKAAPNVVVAGYKCAKKA